MIRTLFFIMVAVLLSGCVDAPPVASQSEQVSGLVGRVTYKVYSDRPGIKIEFCTPNVGPAHPCRIVKTNKRTWTGKFKGHRKREEYRLRAWSFDPSAQITVEVLYDGHASCTTIGFGHAVCVGNL